MSPESSTIPTPAESDRLVLDRDAEVTGAVRCGAYGVYSTLLASPHEIDCEEQIKETGEALGTQPYGIDLKAIVGTYRQCPQTRRKLEYSQLFEVGDRGPPIAIREQQQFSHLAGVRENLLRFYDFFGYTLHEHSAWAPDHLSVLLEFCQLLCHGEITDIENRLSFQLAQADFVSRHLLHWAPVFADRIATVSPQSIYSEVASSLRDLVTRDYEWQVSTIITTGEGGDSE